MKEAWSRSASVVWTPAFDGNSPIIRYIIQFWRYQTSPRKLHEVTVNGAHISSAILSELKPGLTYEVTIVAENEIGRSESIDSITFKTSEEEPSAAPVDMTLEAKGPSTIRVTWKAPPKESWNGELKGFYIGYRKTESSEPYSYKSVEAKPFNKDSDNMYEYFLRNMQRGTEYSIIIKCHNAAGSGPQSNEHFISTLDGNLSPPLQLHALSATVDSISLRWASPEANPQTPITGYIIHYQREGDIKWLEMPVSALSSTESTVVEPGETGFPSNTHVLKNLVSGTQYKIFVDAINKYGVGDPSNIVVARTDGGKSYLKQVTFNLAG